MGERGQGECVALSFHQVQTRVLARVEEQILQVLYFLIYKFTE